MVIEPRRSDHDDLCRIRAVRVRVRVQGSGVRVRVQGLGVRVRVGVRVGVMV